MKYFVRKEWHGPGPVGCFIFNNDVKNNKYYLYVDYIESIQDVLIKFNKKFFIAGVCEFKLEDLKNILMHISMNQYKTEKNEILHELRVIIKKELSENYQVSLTFEGV